VTLAGAFAVHELLYEDEAEASVSCPAGELHVNEAVGQDIRVGSDGVWRDVMREGEGKGGKSWNVSAGPIEHRGKLNICALAKYSERSRVHSTGTDPSAAA